MKFYSIDWLQVLRRICVRASILTSIAVSLSVGIASANTGVATEQHVWFAAAGEGIYHGNFSNETGKITGLKAVQQGVYSDYIVKHPNLDVLYSINNLDQGSTVASYAITQTGSLRPQSALFDRPSGGAHININNDGTLLAVAYYSAGVTGIYALDESGAIVSTVLEHQHEGKSIIPSRQKSPHPHWAGFSEDGRFLLVPDLGTDHIWIYKTNGAKAKAKFFNSVKVTPGSGPRHLAFHNALSIVYVTDELSAKVSAYSFDQKTGELNLLETVVAAEESRYELWANVSDLRVHPSGEFLYVVNRGLDRVSVFAIDQETGKLSPVEREPVRGSISRNIVISSDGRWALVAAVKSNSVAVFSVDQKNGDLKFMRDQIYAVPNARAIVLGD